MSLGGLLAAYDWRAVVALILLVAVLTKAGPFLVLKVPAFQRTRELNRREDQIRLAREKYPAMIKRTIRAGKWSNLVFFLVLAPFVVTVEMPPPWRVLLDIVTILMVYDFFYYLAHRFLLHAAVDSRFAVLRYFRRVHAVHHQARDPSYVDSMYVHPLETAIGMALLVVSICGLSLIVGRLNVASVAIASVIFHAVGMINHIRIDLPGRPYRPLNWMVMKHHVHHENMQKGNYAGITLLYDKLFGTLD
jgi:sterol desaturase/sphingolipid hydroxylase (fatty acid hydroxylase superfamily)